MWGRAVLAAGITVLLLAGCGGGSSSGPPTLNWYIYNEPGGTFKTAATRCTKQAHGRYKVNVVPLPTDADQQRELIVRRLAAEDSSVDLIGMDVIWTAEFAGAKWIEPWEGERRARATAGVIPATLATATYKNQLFAAPFTTNTQVLFYRKSRVKQPPKTWGEMIAQAKQIGPAKGRIQIQGARYEGLVVWFNSLVGSAGGQILRPDGSVALGPPAVRAAQVMHDLASSPVADPALSNNKEDEARLAFESGTSAFELNYTFAYTSATEKGGDFLKDIGVARWPSVNPGQPSHVTLGGFNIGVGAFGKHKDLAFDAALCLKQPENQIVATTGGGLLPTSASLYDDPRFRKALPFTQLLKDEIATGVARPVSPAYSDISQAIQRTLHPPADIDPEQAISDMRDKLKRARDGKLF
jgi:trehalose/maltose transport system substrate-binding protein